MPELITRVTVWSSRLRWAHALMGLSVLLLLATGGLSQTHAAVAASARGYHYFAAYVFAFSLAYRVFLLFLGTKSEHIGDFMPKVSRQELVSQHLRFYLSLGKSELPGWYAHNPFWGPIYIAVFALSLFLILTGFAIGNVYMGPGISLTGLHAFAAGLMLVFVALHVFAVVLHDVKAENTGISAMLSGARYFSKTEEKPASPVEFPVAFTVKSPKKQGE